MDWVPIMYEDENEGDMGESSLHVGTDEILHIGVQAHLAGREELRVFSNMNLYYPAKRASKKKGPPYVSPDLMVVKPFRDLGEDVTSYFIGKDGPAPLLVMEILSKRSAQQQDLGKKLRIYAAMGIPEYVIVDASGKRLSLKLLIKRLQPDRTWKDARDADGGITSQLGFRVIIDSDGHVRVLDAATGKRYLRPGEAQSHFDAVRQHVDELEAEVARLRELLKGQGKKQK
jgi:Uma2 family endonuclease